MRQGFSLVELMLVVAVAGLLFGIALPRLSGALDHIEVQSEANHLVAAHRRARIMAVTSDDVQRVARKYINPESLQIIAVGDASKIRSVLEKFGTVTVYDAEGKPEAARPSATTTTTRPGQ